MKVLYLSPSFFPATKYGGPIYSSLNMIKELVALGMNINVHTTNVNGSDRLDVNTSNYTQLAELPGVNIRYHKETITNRFSFSMFINIPKLVKKSDLVHTQSIFSICTPLAIFWSGVYHKNVIISPRGSLGGFSMNKKSIFKKIWLNILFKPFISRVHWHVTAEFEKQDIIDNFPAVPLSHIKIIPNGINKEQHEYLSLESLSSKLNVPLKKNYILVVGRIDRKKGIDYTIRSLVDVTDVELVILGPDYGAQKELELLAESLSVASRVHFLGHHDGIIKWSLYYHANLFCLNSRHENFGNVYLEALSVGTPILASTNTPWEFINDTGAGLCVNNKPKEIAECINEIKLWDKEEVSSSCLNIASRYYWSELAINMKQFYEEVI